MLLLRTLAGYLTVTVSRLASSRLPINSVNTRRDAHIQPSVISHRTILFISTNASMTTRRPPLMDISNNDIASSPAETGARRKSGRAVRAPQKFIPDAPPHTGRAKRKREGDDVENDASDIEDEEEASSDDTGDSSGEEEVREVRRKPKQSKTAKKPAAKKPKVNGTVAHEAAPVVKLPNRPKKAKKVLITGDDDEGLYGECIPSQPRGLVLIDFYS